MEITTGRYFRRCTEHMLDGYVHYYYDNKYWEQSIVDITYIIKHIQRR